MKKWISAGVCLVGICLLAGYDIYQNYVNLNSYIGGVCFTFCGSAAFYLANDHHKVLCLIAGVSCVAISANMNIDNHLKPHDKQKQLRVEKERLEKTKWTQEELEWCWGQPSSECVHRRREDHNKRVDMELIPIINQIDPNWVDISLNDKKWIILSAIAIPFSLAVFCGVAGSIFQRNGKKKVRKLFEIPFKRFETDLKQNETDLIDFETRTKMQNLYREVCKRENRLINQKEFRKELRDSGIKGVSCHKKRSWWWDNHRPEVDVKKPLIIERNLYHGGRGENKIH